MPATVLIIEDHPDNLDLVCYLLRAAGHTPITASDGLEGLALAERSRPDLIICDLQLPGIDGFEVIRRLNERQVLSRIPCIAVTAYAMVGDRERALSAGFNDHISKPIDPETFIAQVNAHLPATKKSDLPFPRPAPAPASPESPADVVPTTPMAVRAPVPRHMVNGQGRRVVVVDDSSNNLAVLTDTLRAFGFRVTGVASMTDAISTIRKLKPDIILSDWHMPGGTGYEFLREIKTDPTLAAIPFVLISSSLRSAKMENLCLVGGAVRFIQRPIEPEALAAAIADCLPGNGSEVPCQAS